MAGAGRGGAEGEGDSGGAGEEAGVVDEVSGRLVVAVDQGLSGVSGRDQVRHEPGHRAGGPGAAVRGELVGQRDESGAAVAHGR